MKEKVEEIFLGKEKNYSSNHNTFKERVMKDLKSVQNVLFNV